MHRQQHAPDVTEAVESELQHVQNVEEQDGCRQVHVSHAAEPVIRKVRGVRLVGERG